MNLFQKIKYRLSSDEHKKKMLIHEIRQSFACFGYDTSDMSDEDIVDGLRRAHTVLREASFTAEEISEALSKLHF